MNKKLKQIRAELVDTAFLSISGYGKVDTEKYENRVDEILSQWEAAIKAKAIEEAKQAYIKDNLICDGRTMQQKLHTEDEHVVSWFDHYAKSIKGVSDE